MSLATLQVGQHLLDLVLLAQLPVPGIVRTRPPLDMPHADAQRRLHQAAGMVGIVVALRTPQHPGGGSACGPGGGSLMEPADRAGHRVQGLHGCMLQHLPDGLSPGLPVLIIDSLEPGYDGLLDSLARLGCTRRPEPEGPPAPMAIPTGTPHETWLPILLSSWWQRVAAASYEAAIMLTVPHQQGMSAGQALVPGLVLPKHVCG